MSNPKDAAELLPLVYDELRRLAAARLSSEKPGQTLQATALVHEAWLKIGRRDALFADRTHFLRAAATAMRQILVDRARSRNRDRRGGGQSPEPFEENQVATSVPDAEIVAVDEALTALAREDPQSAQIVELRYFAGMSVPEVAEALGMAPRTVDRHWAFARAWLRRAIRSGESTVGA